MMLFYPHHNFLGQQDGQNPSLATRARQTLDKIRHASLHHSYSRATYLNRPTFF